MMADVDPMDYLEPDDYAIYEDKYADEFDEIEDIEEEELDFNLISRPKPKYNEEKKINTASNLKESTKDEGTKDENHTKDGFSAKNDCLSKRSFSEAMDLSSWEKEKENVVPHQGLKPKKLKLDGEVDFNIVWGIESSPSVTKGKTTVNAQREEVSKTINQLKCQPSSFDEESYHRTRQRVFSRPVFGKELLNVTSTEGDRVFLKLCSEDELPSIEENRWSSNSSVSGLNLLSVPFDQLKNEVQERIHTQRIMGNDNELSQRQESTIIDRKASDSGELWVEKYTPKRYTELLSDDGTNRFVLKWLKLWDHVVFGIEPPKEKEKESDTDGKDSQSTGFPNKDNKAGFQKFEKKFLNPEDDLVMDPKGRPKKKLALLCGSPGLGKTTLAHVISQHAGYNVVEMNASDDRSPEVFLNKIETSTQMKAVIGQTKKPNCLVIDEIDGAPIQAINILLELVKTTETSGSGGKGVKGKKKRKKREFVLNRPVICICNDQFVPALRQLRQVAFTLKFPPTLSNRLAGRLLAISQREKMRIDMSAVLQLADKTENDIRSCLNTLQFINQKKKEFKLEDLKNLEVGQKDMKKGVRVILNELFKLPKLNKKKFIEKFTAGSESKSSLTNRFHYILHLVYGNSEFDKLMQGLFDQYLLCKTKDPYLESINLGNEWLGFTDIVKNKVSSNQDYVLWRFLSFLPVAFHMYFARATAGKVQYSNVSYENNLKLNNNLQTMQLVTNGMSPNLRRNCCGNVLTTDLMPYLFTITLPNLRPVNTKLYSESEKQIFASLVNTLISYNLTYRQEKNLEGQYTYVLEPNIEELVTYPGLPQRRQLLYATKQLIAREVELEKMRQAEQVIKTTDGDADKVAVESTGTGKSTSNKVNVVQRQKLVPKKFADRPQLDFFGRVIKPQETKAKESSVKKTVDDEKVSLVMNTKTWFRFNEGYTNAVRRTIKLPEFL